MHVHYNLLVFFEQDRKPTQVYPQYKEHRSGGYAYAQKGGLDGYQGTG